MPIQISGKNVLGSQSSAEGGKTFRALNPQKNEQIEPAFHEATEQEIDRALELADRAVPLLWQMPAAKISEFLMAVREEILGLGNELLEKASEESALPLNRLSGERDRTTNQLKMFADVVSEGSWVDARIETALPERKPTPRPDLRRMMQPLGPVAVFGASNFPLAFSVAGGDTASAFAAKNPVIVKAHPAHPGTSELVATAVRRAVTRTGMPEGTFSMVHGFSPDVSLALVRHPKTQAVGFTGSLRAGRALFDAAARRPEPIPVYAEMGSLNPVFILPEAMKTRGEAIAEGLFQSVTAGLGQFCTCPGLVFGLGNEALESFREKLGPLFNDANPGTMLNSNIAKGYRERLETVSKVSGVESQLSAQQSSPDRTEAQPGAFFTDAQRYLAAHELHDEIFGPATIVIRCQNREEMMEAASKLEGSLTATIHGTPEELAKNSDLIDVLSRKAGRLIFNGFPTGVEVGNAMHHGGPWPATTDSKFTSVGVTAIYRFVRPVCYQSFPESLLPPELQNGNPRNIWRTVNGQLTKDAI